MRSVGNSGIQASTMGLGTWAIGGAFWGGANKKDSVAVIQKAIDLGVNLIDTAPVYGFGEAELVIGEAISGQRDKVVISTKCGLDWQTTHGTFVVSEENKEIYRYLGKDFLREELENSLRRLNTDYIDIYFTHWQDETTPLDETMEALRAFKKQGKIRAIGASNVTLDQLKQYQSLGGIDVAQEEYSLLHRNIEEDLLPFCIEHNISMFSYCTLCQGLLTGKMKPGHHFSAEDMRARMESFSDENIKRAEVLNQNLQLIADQYQASLAQLIIAWTLVQPGVSHALCGARNVTQLTENIKGADIELSNQDINKIRHLAENSDVFFSMYQ